MTADALDQQIDSQKHVLQKLTGGGIVVPQGWDQHTILVLAISLLVFTLLLFVIMGLLIYHNGAAESVLRTFGTLLIIVAAVLLVVLGYGEAQIAPVIGLLGTVAGYLLGKTAHSPDPPPKDESKPTKSR